MPDLALGIDIGGTGIKLGLVNAKGKLAHTVRLPTPRNAKPGEVVDLVSREAQQLLAQAGIKSLVGIGVGCAGDIDPVRGLVRISPNLAWSRVPLKAMLSKHLKHPILVDNDANVAAWAAYVVESERLVKNLVCVTVGTGIGGGLVLNGKLYHGTTGSAGEIGHMTLYPDGAPCPCGNRGCTERYIGARAMVEEARQAIKKGEKTIVPKLVHHNLSAMSALVLKEAALHGDRLALRLWKQAGERLGITLASIVNLLNPEWIVLAGGLSRAGDLLLKPLERTIRERSFKTPAKAAKLVLSRLDQDLGMVGAGLLAHELFK